MSLIQIFDTELSAEFRSFLQSIKKNIESYTKAKQTAQKERMIIIGKITEHRQAFPQRSYEHAALSKAMNEEGWSKDVIYQNNQAYRMYKNILEDHCKDYHPIAYKASVSQLAVIGQAQLSTYELIMYIRRNRELPPVSALRGRAGGYFDDKFQPLRKSKPKSLPDTTTSAKEVHVEVVADNSTSFIEEVVETKESELIEDLVSVVQMIDLDTVYGDDELKGKLEKVKRPLMALAHMAIPIPKKPTYV